MATVAPADIFAYLVQEHGVSSAVAAGILVNIQYESGFSTTAVGDSGTSGGLFQHHATRWESLKSYAASTGRLWTDWTAQVDFAIQEAKSMGINLSSNDPVAASKEWTIKFERPADMYTKATQRASDVYKYTSLDPNATYSTSPGSGNTMTSSTSQEALNIPPDAIWYKATNGNWIVAFDVMAPDGRKGEAFSVVYYRSTVPPPDGVTVKSAATFDKYSAAWIDGGTVDALRGIPKGTTYQDLVNETLFELGLMGSDAVLDQGVMDIVALAMTRELSPTELANRLRSTAWYQSHTDKEREWDDLADAEKDQRIQDSMSQLVSSWFTYVGEALNVMEYDSDGDGLISAAELKAGNPELFTWSQNVASGKATVVTAVNTWMKDKALENPDSPWARTIREEEIAQGQFGADIENLTGEIEDLYREWAYPLTDDRASRYAEKILMNQMTMEDVEDALERSAMARYPTKPPGMSVMEWAQPYMASYQNLLETAEPDLMDNHIQAALSDGLNMAEFNDMLRQDDRWLETDNARNEMYSQVGQLGRQMGF